MGDGYRETNVNGRTDKLCSRRKTVEHKKKRKMKKNQLEKLKPPRMNPLILPRITPLQEKEPVNTFDKY